MNNRQRDLLIFQLINCFNHRACDRGDLKTAIAKAGIPKDEAVKLLATAKGITDNYIDSEKCRSEYFSRSA